MMTKQIIYIHTNQETKKLHILCFKIHSIIESQHQKLSLIIQYILYNKYDSLLFIFSMIDSMT